MTDEAFILYRGAPGRVLRLRLYPITVGHMFVLSELGADIGDASTDALALSCLVCASRTDREARATLASVFLPLFLRVWSWYCCRLVHTDEVEKWERYLEANLAVPETEPPPSDKSRELRSPEHWRLATMLMVEFHMTWREAMDTPVATARALWAVEGDRRGDVVLTDPGHRARAHALKEAMKVSTWDLPTS